jgi:hypothetical protein
MGLPGKRTAGQMYAWLPGLSEAGAWGRGCQLGVQTHMLPGRVPGGPFRGNNPNSPNS